MDRILIYLLFTLSGCVGLIYEALWSRYLKLLLGHVRRGDEAPAQAQLPQLLGELSTPMAPEAVRALAMYTLQKRPDLIPELTQFVGVQSRLSALEKSYLEQLTRTPSE